MSKSKPAPAPQALASIGGIAGAAGGWALSQYAGASMWIPMLAAGVLFALFVKTSFGPRDFRGAIAITAGHVAWFLVAMVVVGNWSATVLDVVLLSGSVIWLWLRPSLAPLALLGVVQLISLGINLTALFSVAVGSAEHRALTVHCILRLLAIIALVTGHRQMQRTVAAPST